MRPELSLFCLLAALGTAAAQDELRSPSGLTGADYAERVAAREGGERVRQDLLMVLTDPSGSVVERDTVYMALSGEGTAKSIIYFEDPAKLRGTAFMTYDHEDAGQADDQWLYLPAVGRSRRISSADRGDYFLGTDFTYEDIKIGTGLPTTDFDFAYAGSENLDGVELVAIEGHPVDSDVASQLGYGKVRVLVHEPTSMVIKADYWDTAMNPLKTVRMYDIRPVQGILTAHRLVAENHKTDHRTEFRFSDVDYDADVEDEDFTEAAMRRGF